MDFKIVNQKDNMLLSRKEITIEIGFFGKKVPSKEEVKDKLSKDLKVDSKLIVVKKVFTNFGSSTAKVLAYSYVSEEELKKIEPKPKVKKDKAAAPKE